MLLYVVSTLGNDWTPHDNNIIIVNTHTHARRTHTHNLSSWLSRPVDRLAMPVDLKLAIVDDNKSSTTTAEKNRRWSTLAAVAVVRTNLAVSHRDALDRRAVITALGQILLLLLRSFVIAVASTMSRARDSHTSLRHWRWAPPCRQHTLHTRSDRATPRPRSAVGHKREWWPDRRSGVVPYDRPLLTPFVFVCFSRPDSHAFSASSAAAAAAGSYRPGGAAATAATVRGTADVWCGCGQEGWQQPVAGPRPTAAVHQARQAPEEDRDQWQEQPAHQQ